MNNFVKNRLFKRSMWTLLTIFFALIMIIFLIIAPITQQYSQFVDQFFGITSRTLLVDAGDVDDQESQYYLSEFAVRDEDGNLVYTDKNGIKKQTFDSDAMREKSMAVAEEVCEEGMVLLWNNNASDGKPALPLNKGDKVSALGVGSANWQYHGLGSGYVKIYDESLLDVKAALTAEDVGLEFNDTMPGVYETATKRGYGISLSGTNEYPWASISAAGKESIVQYGDAAIFIVSRYYGEGFDINSSQISFSKAELGVLTGLKAYKDEGKIKKIIVVINNPSQLNVDEVSKAEYGVDACIWAGYPGAAGLKALADLLVGNSNPSGHLTDTWAYNVNSAPSSNNFGNFSYYNVTVNVPSERTKYVVYQEGIYVGYRYYETRYEDAVMGKGEATAAVGMINGTDKWSYTDEVAFPFGHGVSYTTFAYSDYSVKKSGTDYTVSVTVKNTGNVAGKDAVQIYLQKPYTQYDIENKVEKAAVELVGFVKTGVIEPQATETVTVTVSEYDFKSYDSNGAGTYILEKGDYYLAAGQNAHDALNNILAAKGYKTANGMDYDGDSKLTYKTTYNKDDFETYSVAETGYKIENQFDNADINRSADMEGQSITYLSRNNWKDTWSGGVMLNLDSESLAKWLQYSIEVKNDPEEEMPLFDKVTSEYGKLNLIQLKGVAYNDPLWTDLLNQLTYAEQVDLVKGCAAAGTKNANSPGITQRDGPCGLTASKMPLPCNPIVASTFNKELVEKLGVAYGTEMLVAGYTGIYGVGANTHRSAYGGRSWEYYSEDGFLAGTMNSFETKGMRSMGVVMFTKHFVLNDQEMNRGYGVHTWSNEQAIREIYLKAFETAITDGYCNGLMTSFNSLGGVWVGQHEGLLTNVLRNEWGFTGITITDAVGSNTYMGAGSASIIATALMAGQDAWMGGMTTDALDSYKDNATVMNALREACHRILYTQLDSMAMNGFTSTTEVYLITPAWENALVAFTIVAGVLMGLCLLMTAASWALWYMDKQKNNNLTEVK